MTFPSAGSPEFWEAYYRLPEAVRALARLKLTTNGHEWTLIQPREADLPTEHTKYTKGFPDFRLLNFFAFVRSLPAVAGV